ncbi:MAG: hypothetical protein AB9873_08625 [Syntrophobacteraceae bacterium]
MSTNRNEIGLTFLGGMAMLKALRNVRSLAAILAKCLFLGVLAAGCASHQVAVTDNAALLSNPNSLDGLPPEGAPRPKRASFEREARSRNAQLMADWVVEHGDNRGMPFVIVDKMDAKVFVLDADGRLRGAAPALLGLARGDDSIPGIGDRKLSDIRPEERTTPAGRFVASLGRNFAGKDVLWVDYDLAISLHRVVTNNPTERRLERLATATPFDNRISFGCINVPAKFYDSVVSPTFTGTYGIVYVLPETRSNTDIFAAYYEVECSRGTDTPENLADESPPGLPPSDSDAP